MMFFSLLTLFFIETYDDKMKIVIVVNEKLIDISILDFSDAEIISNISTVHRKISSLFNQFWLNLSLSHSLEIEKKGVE